MTDDAPAAPPAGGQAAAEAPQIRVLAQYITDSSFENPGAPASLRAGQPAPNIDLAIDVRAQRGENDTYEVTLHIEAKAMREDQTAFLVELKYSGLFAFANIPEANLEPVLLVECPRMLFPFARRIVAEQTRDGGFPPLYIDPIDFMRMYMQQRAAREGAAANGGAASATQGDGELN